MCLELRPQRRGIKEETDLDACVYIYIHIDAVSLV